MQVFSIAERPFAIKVKQNGDDVLRIERQSLQHLYRLRNETWSIQQVTYSIRIYDFLGIFLHVEYELWIFFLFVCITQPGVGHARQRIPKALDQVLVRVIATQCYSNYPKAPLKKKNKRKETKPSTGPCIFILSGPLWPFQTLFRCCHSRWDFD